MFEIKIPVRFKKTKEGLFLEPVDTTEFPDLFVKKTKRRQSK